MKIARTTFDVYLKSENIFEVEFNLDGDLDTFFKTAKTI